MLLAVFLIYGSSCCKFLPSEAIFTTWNAAMVMRPAASVCVLCCNVLRRSKAFT